MRAAPHFDGADYSTRHDKERLTGQILRVYELMADRVWRSLGEISRSTRDPESSVSAQLRNLRKKRFGGHTVNRRTVGDRSQGLYEYQLVPAPRQMELIQ